ncbi:MAG: hypothetical protein E6J43_03815 [Chloroflexi bacterium]|nr:MAG: hypothetical protein E6J43_03815 [Chloroflexota bacterium]
MLGASLYRRLGRFGDLRGWLRRLYLGVAVGVHDEVERFEPYEAILIPVGSLVRLLRVPGGLNFQGRSDRLNIRLGVMDRSLQTLFVLIL